MSERIGPKEYISEQLALHNIKIPEEYQTVFDNHVDVLTQRILNNECVSTDTSEMEEQLDQESLDLSEKTLSHLFTEYGVEPSRTEIVLFAIYINLAKEEEKNNG